MRQLEKAAPPPRPLLATSVPLLSLASSLLVGTTLVQVEKINTEEGENDINLSLHPLSGRLLRPQSLFSLSKAPLAARSSAFELHDSTLLSCAGSLYWWRATKGRADLPPRAQTRLA